MDRRNFLRIALGSSGAMMVGMQLHCQRNFVHPRIFPKGSTPIKFYVLRRRCAPSWHEKNFLTCLQGLLNRNQTRIYCVHSKSDKFWLDYYQELLGIESVELADYTELLRSYGSGLSGYIRYDPEKPHELNIATTMGALQNAVPLSAPLESRIRESGLKKIDDISGRWKNLYDAYEWALKNLQPLCNQQIMAQLCVHHPYWTSSTFTNRDYAIAHKMFACDISSSERDKRDYRLLRKIYQAFPQGATILGWHCVRDKEHEAIALASEFGHHGVCCLNTPNLTVHSSIPLAANESFRQRRIESSKFKIENKIYVALMATDGDAAWFMLNLCCRDWKNPLHGELRYNWGFLPMAFELMPGVVRYYMRNMLPQDYFVAGPSGAAYAYPHLHPDPTKFLRLSQFYMEKCGLTTVHITNWNDRDWWQEVDLPKFPALLNAYMPECVGYVRGMGESAFEAHYLNGDKPYLFCGEGIHSDSDVFMTLKNFVDACPNRPLFIYCLVNHSVTMDRIQRALEKFPPGKIELLHLDELLSMVQQAYAEGRITEELYPEKESLRALLSEEAKSAWRLVYEEIQRFEESLRLDEAAYRDSIRDEPIGLEQIEPADFVAFAAIWHGMALAKCALESKGIYVNHKPTATRRFAEEFGYLEDAKIIDELQTLWDNWHASRIDFSEAVTLGDRLVRLTALIHQACFSEVSA
ncbi:hypothetical protein JXJ21_12095 [candidate division KSB1 bacterium]|nr:hypothetical protein [candidate division KSB1 bacterium]